MKETTKTKDLDFILYSDGGGEKGNSAAGACIIEDTKTKNRVYLATFLGGATNNESEITAGLLGYSFLNAKNAESKTEKNIIQWVCDSEYVLKSATEYIHGWQRNGWKTAAKDPVKNQGLWRAFLQLSKGFKIIPTHIRGHSGHPENELCDSVSTWVRLNGEERLSEADVEGHGFCAVSLFEKEWFLFNGASFLNALRGADYQEDDISYFTNVISQHVLSRLGVDCAERNDTPQKGNVKEVIKKLREARAFAGDLAKKDEEFEPLVTKLDQVLSWCKENFDSK